MPRLEDCVNDHCPWSGKPVSADSLTLYDGHVVGFCNPGCRDKFAADPDRYQDAKTAFSAAIAAREGWYRSAASTGAELATAAAKGTPFAVLFERPGLTVERFAPRRIDTQQPHARDELYLVARGTAVFDRDGKRVRVAPGDLLFVPARMAHRFREISDDFETWVLFWG
jgi:mannose-6-phosphate isomerase-like protein (cupin superfamily)